MKLNDLMLVNEAIDKLRDALDVNDSEIIDALLNAALIDEEDAGQIRGSRE